MDAKKVDDNAMMGQPVSETQPMLAQQQPQYAPQQQ